MKVGDLIRCANGDACRKKLADLSEAGYGAVVANNVTSDTDFWWIRITSLPEENQKAKESDFDKKAEEFDYHVICDFLVPVFVSMITAIIVTMLATQQ